VAAAETEATAEKEAAAERLQTKHEGVTAASDSDEENQEGVDPKNLQLAKVNVHIANMGEIFEDTFACDACGFMFPMTKVLSLANVLSQLSEIAVWARWCRRLVTYLAGHPLSARVARQLAPAVSGSSLQQVACFNICSRYLAGHHLLCVARKLAPTGSSSSLQQVACC
jgi:hypothetical protein